MTGAKSKILASVRVIVLAEGYAALSTRKVAKVAGVSLSQIHYHFGTKEQLVLATLALEDARLQHRQKALYAGDEPLSAQWRRACDYFDQDLESGYVRLLQELTAAGWSNAVVNSQMRELTDGWQSMLTDAFRRTAARGVAFDPFTVEQLVALTVAVFNGAESMILSGAESPAQPVRQALRAVGQLLEAAEANALEVSS